MKYKTPGVLCALCTLLFPLSLLGQVEEEIDITFSIVSLAGRIPKLSFESDSKISTLRIGKAIRSEKLSYQGSPVISFFEIIGNADPSTGEVKRKELGRVAIPKSSKDLLFVFTKTHESALPYRVTPIPDDIATFQPGMFRFINLAPWDLAIEIGDTRKTVPSRNFTDIKANGLNQEFMPFRMFSLVDGADAVSAFKGSIYYSDQNRQIYVVSPRAKGKKGRVSFTVIPQRITRS